MYLFLLAAWALNSFGVWANPDGTTYAPSQLGVVKNIYVGKLSCAGRLLPNDYLQTWCYKGTRLVDNQMIDMSQTSVAFSTYENIGLNEPTAGISWLVARVEGNLDTVGYQIGYYADASKPTLLLSGQF